MPEDRSLHLRFILQVEEDLTPEDFIGLFECAETFARHVVEREALQLFSDLDLPEEWTLGTLQRIHRLGRRVPVPARVVRVERGSWNVELLLPGAAVLWLLKNYVDPVIREAWDDSRVRHLIVEFLRDRVFLAARRSLEEKAVVAPRHRQLEVQAVSEPQQASREESHIEIRLVRREIMEARLTDQELLDDFIRRLRREG